MYGAYGGSSRHGMVSEQGPAVQIYWRVNSMQVPDFQSMSIHTVAQPEPYPGA